MIHIKQRSLRTFEQKALALAGRPEKIARRIRRKLKKTFAVFQTFRKNTFK